VFWELWFSETWSSHKKLCCGIKVYKKKRGKLRESLGIIIIFILQLKSDEKI